jgi:hypothetical protein
MQTMRYLNYEWLLVCGLWKVVSGFPGNQYIVHLESMEGPINNPVWGGHDGELTILKYE